MNSGSCIERWCTQFLGATEPTLVAPWCDSSTIRINGWEMAHSRPVRLHGAEKGGDWSG